MVRRLVRGARRRKAAPQEPDARHGDWRLELDNPLEAEHLEVLPVRSLFRRTRAHANYLRNVAVPYYGQDFYGSYGEEVQDWEPAHGLKRGVRLALALFVLLPLSVVLVFALMMQLYHAAPAMSDIGFWLSVPIWFSLMGGLLFVSLKISLVLESALVYVYVLGHELTHALAALVSFGRVQAVHVDRSGGYVETDADNLFIALSPYFVPLWMLCWLGVLSCVNYWWPFEAFGPWLYGGLGFWWTFHLYWTVWIIPREQPDMLENGLLFSMLLVMLANVGILVVILCCFGVVNSAGFLQDVRLCALCLYDLFAYVGSWLGNLLK